jgi:hypothetical protein
MNSPRPSHDPATETRIRELAYFLWVDAGCPPNNDHAYWYAAEKTVLTVAPAEAAPSPHYSIRATLAEHQSDPTHRFHDPAKIHDSRLDVVAGEARQRVRGRHGGTPRG